MTEETAGDLIAEATDAAAADTNSEDGGVLSEVAESGDKNTADLLSGDESGGSEGVPETYTFEPPEGLNIDEDTKGRIDAFAETAREMGLTQQQYQSLIEYDINRAQQLNEAAVEGWNGRVEGWRQSAKTDKEIGGERFEENIAVAESAIKQFGDPDLRALLRSPSQDNPEGMALGNHPAVLRFLNRVGKAIADPSLITGERQPPVTRPEERMYPSMFDK